MFKSLIKGTILGGIVLYVWMMISWMALPWHGSTTEKFTNEQAVANVIMDNATREGVYILPNVYQETTNMEANASAMSKGPIVFASIQKRGFDVTSPKPYIISIVIYLLGAFFVSYLLFHAREASYWHKVWFTTVFGIALGILANFPDWNWWGFSTGYTLVSFADCVIGWFLAGLVLAGVVKGTRGHAK